ncbi:Uncharacterised protein [Pantoea agglomerans]|uniref:DUF551 domain-containing protein n=1 Tax=Enterobacter agglomerans TaxID=549 RepID=A0A6N3HG00_ENTAG
MSNIDKQAVQAVADLKAGYTLGHADLAILNELARIALASLEAEAVCVIDQSNLDYLKSGADADVWPASRKEMGDVLLYRTAPPAPANAEPVAWLWSHRKHPSEVTLVRPEDDERAEGAHWSGWSCQALYAAPPAPVSVPDAMEMDDDFDSAFEHGKAVGWNACRAAMLQGANGTLTNEGTITATQFKPVADLYGLTSPTGGETSFTFDAVEARDFIDGGWSCQEYVELGRFQEAVSGNSPVIPGCSCLTCRPLTFSDSRFVVCPECGNKRCPHANDHRNACTGSNEPGQEGSAYPAAPQQEVESQIRKGKTVAMEEWELGARLTKHRFKP